jgi:nitroreductase
MPSVNKIIKNRHTTRLMDGNLSDGDIEIILDSAKRAPSKNRIYGYKIFALTDSLQSYDLKQELCDKITLYKENDNVIYLMQTKAPLVLVYMATPSPEHQMVDVKEKNGKEIYDKQYSEVSSTVDKYAMIKSSVRDAMISATYAQLTAEDMGYGTAFVACGLEDIMYNEKFIKLFEDHLPSFDTNAIEPVIILCIGPKHQKIKDLFNNNSTTRKEPYLDGVTHYKRIGREESFVVNDKQKTMIINL